MALLLVNGVLLALSSSTRRLGLGILLGVVAAVPVGLGVVVFGIVSFSY